MGHRYWASKSDPLAAPAGDPRTNPLAMPRVLVLVVAWKDWMTICGWLHIAAAGLTFGLGFLNIVLGVEEIGALPKNLISEGSWYLIFLFTTIVNGVILLFPGIRLRHAGNALKSFLRYRHESEFAAACDYLNSYWKCLVGYVAIGSAVIALTLGAVLLEVWGRR